jgi:hypothetical protein
MSSLELNSSDRCDQCGVQAWVRVWLQSGGSDLLLCGHHFATQETRLRELDSMWDDQRSRINAKLDVSA